MIASILILLCVSAAPCRMDEAVYSAIVTGPNCMLAAQERLIGDDRALALILSGARPHIECDYGRTDMRPAPKDRAS